MILKGIIKMNIVISFIVRNYYCYFIVVYYIILILV